MNPTLESACTTSHLWGGMALTLAALLFFRVRRAVLGVAVFVLLKELVIDLLTEDTTLLRELRDVGEWFAGMALALSIRQLSRWLGRE